MYVEIQKNKQLMVRDQLTQSKWKPRDHIVNFQQLQYATICRTSS